MQLSRYTDVVTLQDDATPHTSHNTQRKLNSIDEKGGWNIKLVTQPAQSLDLDVNDRNRRRCTKWY